MCVLCIIRKAYEPPVRTPVTQARSHFSSLGIAISGTVYRASLVMVTTYFCCEALREALLSRLVTT